MPLIARIFSDAANAPHPLLPNATSHATRYLRASSPEADRLDYLLEMFGAPDPDPSTDIYHRSNANPPRP